MQHPSGSRAHARLPVGSLATVQAVAALFNNLAKPTARGLELFRLCRIPAIFCAPSNSGCRVTVGLSCKQMLVGKSDLPARM